MLRRFTRQKKSITVTVRLPAADCNAPDWSVSHYIVQVKNPPPAMRPFVKILWITCYFFLLFKAQQKLLIYNVNVESKFQTMTLTSERDCCSESLRNLAGSCKTMKDDERVLEICSKAIIKYPTTPQMRRYTTLRNVCAQKWPCSRAEWSELSCKTQPFETVAEKIFIQWR